MKNKYVINPYLNPISIDPKTGALGSLGHGFFIAESIVLDKRISRLLALFFSTYKRRVFVQEDFRKCLNLEANSVKKFIELLLKLKIFLPVDFKEQVVLKNALLGRKKITPELESSLRANHLVQVTSFGGNGTTMLSQFLRDMGLNIPQGFDWGHWKHMPIPPLDSRVLPGFRAIYLVGDPLKALVSVFRRNFQNFHVRRMLGDVTTWDDAWDLDDFLEHQKDFFGFNKHFHNWTTQKRTYPIMVIKYEKMWKYLPEIFSFVGLSFSHIKKFPKKRVRSTNWDHLPKKSQKKLIYLYGSLQKEINALPDLFIRDSQKVP